MAGACADVCRLNQFNGRSPNECNSSANRTLMVWEVVDCNKCPEASNAIRLRLPDFYGSSLHSLVARASVSPPRAIFYAQFENCLCSTEGETDHCWLASN